MIPPLAAFTPRERRVIRDHRTPRQVQQFLRRLVYNTEPDGETLRTFRGVVRHGTAHCLEAALTSATILEQHGYPPLLLDLASADRLDHVVHLFVRNGRYGSVGVSHFPGLFGRKPVYRSVLAMVRDYVDPFVDYTGRLIAYAVADLRTLRGVDWRLSERNVWAVERWLCSLPHRRIRTSDRRHEAVLRRYRQFKQRYPSREPAAFPTRPKWL